MRYFADETGCFTVLSMARFDAHLDFSSALGHGARGKANRSRVERRRVRLRVALAGCANRSAVETTGRATPLLSGLK